MKTTILFSLALVTALSLATADDKTSDKSLGDKTADALKKAGEKTKEAGRDVVDATKRAADAVVDAVTPDKDARKVEVKLTDHHIDLPKKLESGKTAFVVSNDDKEKHNFEVRGEGIEKKFLIDLSPNETKVLHVDLKPGTYTAFDSGKDQAEQATSEFTVR